MFSWRENEREKIDSRNKTRVMKKICAQIKSRQGKISPLKQYTVNSFWCSWNDREAWVYRTPQHGHIYSTCVVFTQLRHWYIGKGDIKLSFIRMTVVTSSWDFVHGLWKILSCQPGSNSDQGLQCIRQTSLSPDCLAAPRPLQKEIQSEQCRDRDRTEIEKE